jgi:hypothetical protein
MNTGASDGAYLGSDSRYKLSINTIAHLPKVSLTHVPQSSFACDSLDNPKFSRGSSTTFEHGNYSSRSARLRNSYQYQTDLSSPLFLFPNLSIPSSHFPFSLPHTLNPESSQRTNSDTNRINEVGARPLGSRVNPRACMQQGLLIGGHA